MENRHAFMIMSHDNFPVLIEILKGLDHERNDIFLHIDSKVQDFPACGIKEAINRGRLYFVKRIPVSWGGYSQIACELLLMEEAIKTGHHKYYHLMTGATYPIKNIESILDFYDQNEGFEFIGYDNSKDYSNRVKRYNLFNEVGKSTTKADEVKSFIRNKFKGLQKKIGYVYGPAKNIEFKKGFVYWSLTEEAINYALERKEKIEHIFKHSFCGDELFMQTILYNSDFRKNIFDYENEYNSCKRYVKPVQSWDSSFGGGSISQCSKKEFGITVEDVDTVLKSDKLFALKFVGDEGLRAIEELVKVRKAK